MFSDLDVNSNKLGATVEKRNQKLTKLFESIGNLNLGNYSDNTIDVFGDAYEFLMTMYASNAGKSGGEFYTPQEVSELLAEITTVGKKEVNKVYDPACGSGSLLLKFSKVLGKENVRQGFFGQENNITTYNLCRINMFLHDINYNNFDIAYGDTLMDPKHWDDEPFDAIVSNPPYSQKWEGDSNPLLINDPRYSPAGVLAPKSKSDLAFTMHMLSWLSTSGTAAIVEFPGVLYRRGAEGKIRKYLIDNNYIDAVIQLPPDLFFGTTIATCIIVLKKSKKDNKTLFIDASAEFVHVGNKNKLSETNRLKILKVFTTREDKEYFTKLVDNKDIANNDYNIAVSNYVVSEDTREVVDITTLNTKISQIVTRQNELRKSIDEAVSNIEKMIIKFCQNGVKFKEIREICQINRGRVMSKNYLKDNFGEFPVYSSQTADEGVFGYIKTYDYDGEYVTWTTDGAKAGSVFYHNGKFSITNVCGLLKPKENDLDTKFLLYSLSTIAKSYVSAGMGNPKLMSNVMEKIKIPVPPLTVQKEIVAIFNKFQELEAKLELVLEEELSLRQSQNEYYREKLLIFKEYGN